MNSSERRPYYNINLQDYNNRHLTSDGVLEMNGNIADPIQIEIGDDTLELTRASLQTNIPCFWGTKVENVYFLRNLTSPDAPTLLMASNPKEPETDQIDDHYQIDDSSMSYVIGRDTTPDLALSKRASRRHMQIRIGSIVGRLHFKDLDSTHGTIVRLGENPDVGTVNQIRWMERNDKGMLITHEQMHQTWSR